ncbi:unnamed protein product [Cladocopium goreaui]|uniref:Cyclic nucleotide-binding domain-containing protein n=1 Tax=Cladocopium goreaui TaxID=2562237 RepID=A0A9P1M4Y0_9DINO|nr:unnamed protein product [Cladocopium goreaui]
MTKCYDADEVTATGMAVEGFWADAGIAATDIVTQGDAGDESGDPDRAVRYSQISCPEGPAEHRRCYAGDMFGEKALLEKTRRSATVRAVTQVEAVLLLKRAAFERMLGPLSQLQEMHYLCDPRLPCKKQARSLAVVALQRAQNAGTRTPAEIQRVLAPLKEAGSWKPLLQSLKGHADLIYSVVKAILSARLPGLDHACFTIAISACASQWEWACDLFTSMTRAALEPNSISYNALITCCEKGRQWHRALVLLSAMGDNADVFSFSAAISACEKCGHWQIALQLFENMATARVTADEIGFNAAISACEKGGQWPSAAQLLQRMAIRRCLASVVSFSAAISACATEWLAALCMLESMESTQADESMKPVKSNEVTFNALLNCCEKSWQHGLSIADMRQLQLLPDVVTLSTSLSTRFGQWPRALSRFRSFSATSLNLVTFNAMIHTCESSWPLALELFTELGSPDVVSFGSVAAALCRGAKLKEAVQLMKQMTAADLRIDLVSFNASMTSCQAVGRWQEAFFLVDFMLQIEISPDVTSFSCIVTSAAQASWRLALSSFKETMNRVGFCAAINACEKGQRWPQAIHLLQMLRLRADVPSFNAALSCLEGQ